MRPIIALYLACSTLYSRKQEPLIKMNLEIFGNKFQMQMN